MTLKHPADIALGAQIKAELTRRGKKVTDLAEHLGMQRTYLSAKLGGNRPMRLDQVRKIAAYLGGMSVGELIKESEANLVRGNKKSS